MTERVAAILDLARDLSDAEHDELVGELLGADASRPATGSRWTPELERRAREALRGENLVGEASEVIARAREELRAAREARRAADAERRVAR